MKPSKIKFLYGESLDPFENLAIEEYFLQRIKSDEKILIMYLNRPSIVMGRFQNPWLECDIKNILKNDISLVRRQSGGGCVYHDSGNVNFCFINPGNRHQRDENNEVLLKALKSLNIQAYASNRSDILVDVDGPKKISGSAFKQKKDSSFHHGTMLIRSDLTLLNNYLRSEHSQIIGKGIKSVRSTVLNISDLGPSLTIENYIKEVKMAFGTYYNLPVEELKYTPSLVDPEYVLKLKSWEWMFGETPEFELTKSINKFEFYLKSRKGIILDFKISSNLLSKDVLEGLSKELIGLKICKNTLKDLELETKYSDSSVSQLASSIYQLFGF